MEHNGKPALDALGADAKFMQSLGLTADLVNAFQAVLRSPKYLKAVREDQVSVSFALVTATARLLASNVRDDVAVEPAHWPNVINHTANLFVRGFKDELDHRLRVLVAQAQSAQKV